MNRLNLLLTVSLLTMVCAMPVVSQTASQISANTASNAIVPRLVNFSGKAVDADGKTIAGTAGVTFAIYSEQSGGSPLWLETQNVQADSKGNYTAQLGATKSDGLPLDLFTSGDARWLGVRINSGEEQPRVLLLSVPYALKAADAQTLGGLPASAFMLAANSNHANPSATNVVSEAVANGVTAAVSGTGTTDFLPLWTNASGALGNSVLFQSGTGSTAKIGINTTAPAVTLDVNGGENVHGILNLPPTGNATTAGGKNSQPLDLTASAYNSSTKAAVTQKFQWQAEPVGNNTASPSGALSLLFASGSAAPAETGLKIAKNGVITFASGQTFPGAEGVGTVTSVGLTAPSSDFKVSGSPVKSSGNLSLAWNVAPTPAATANAIVKRDSSGSIAANTIIANTGVEGFVAVGPAVYGQSNGTLSGSNGVEGHTEAGPGSGVAGFNDAGGIGVYGSGGGGSSSTGIFGTGTIGVFGTGTYGFATDSNVQQARAAGGWVKAMAYVQGNTPPYSITRCFNSTLAGAAATTPPCGFNLVEEQVGFFQIDFGFEIDDRFILATTDLATAQACTMTAGAAGDGDTIAYVGCNPGGSGWQAFKGPVFVF
jgi:hypothetical protein